MKKGDIVTIRDNSWAQDIVNGRLIEESLNINPEGSDKQYVVIETGCMFPRHGTQKRSFNDTVIQALDFGKVVFIEERFLREIKPKHKIMVDVRHVNCAISGEFVEVSDDCYQKIKRETS